MESLNERKNRGIKERIMEEIALYLKRNEYSFDVGFDPRELDIDNIGKA